MDRFLDSPLFEFYRVKFSVSLLPISRLEAYVPPAYRNLQVYPKLWDYLWYFVFENTTSSRITVNKKVLHGKFYYTRFPYCAPIVAKIVRLMG